MTSVSKVLKDDNARRDAISLHDRSILVEAGAGSGKTAVMAGRIAAMLAEGVAAKKSIGVDAPAEVAAVRELTDKTAELMALEEKLKDAVAGEPEELNERAMYEHETVIPAMEAARKVADELELKVGKAYWPMPTYADLLFYV